MNLPTLKGYPTPKSLEEITQLIKSFPPEQHDNLFRVFGETMNFCSACLASKNEVSK